ncbi:MAG TPA: hypothetical protein VGN91_01270 [Bosea sp. (in: a-proteobacteria)]|nr:hypothetical protein [Bosea sp. (in: a-proteobacteria)]
MLRELDAIRLVQAGRSRHLSEISARETRSRHGRAAKAEPEFAGGLDRGILSSHRFDLVRQRAAKSSRRHEPEFPASQEKSLARKLDFIDSKKS